MADIFSSISNASFGISNSTELQTTGNSLAQNPLSPSDSSSSSGTKLQSFRYPLKRIDSKSDYFDIRIVDYKAPGFKPAEITTGLVDQKDANNPEAVKEITSVTGLSEIGQGSEQYKTNVTTRYYIKLPIPQNLSDTNQVTWGDDTLNPLEAFGVSAGAKFVQSPGKTTKSFVDTVLKGNIGGQLGNAVKENKDIIAASVGGALYNALGGNVSAQGILARASGQILNPNLELLFQGANIRNFPFSFDFAPRDQREAIEVRNIIRALKESIVPATTVTNNSLTKGIFISSPRVFLISYMSGSKKHPFLNSFKPCALTDMQISYTGSGTYSTYQDGTPVHIQMNLTFKELNPIYREDYKNVGGVGY